MFGFPARLDCLDAPHYKRGMNPLRLVLAIFAGFIFIAASDMLIHGLWLGPVYKATHELWRTEEQMNARLGWMFGGQFLIAVTFVTLWAVGFAGNAKLTCALKFGLFMGLFNQSQTMIGYVVTPMPGSLAAKWFCTGIAQAVLLGIVTHLVYKPKAAAAA